MGFKKYVIINVTSPVNYSNNVGFPLIRSV